MNNSNPSRTISPNEWEVHHRAIYAGLAWPEGTLLSVTSQPGDPDKSKRGKLRTEGFALVEDAEAIWRLLRGPANRRYNTWVSVGGLEPKVALGAGRGKAENVVGLPALVVDIDFRSASHAAGDRNPSAEEARKWVDDAPLPPTLTVESGGGLHLWFALTELLHPDSKQGAEALRRHKSWWVARAEADSLSIDAVVLADAARILRPCGTWNANQGRPVTLARALGSRYPIDAIIACYPEAVMPKRKRGTSIAVTTPRERARPCGFAPIPRDSQKVGDRFAYTVPISRLLEEVFDATRSGTGITLPRPDGSDADYESGRIYPAGDEDPERVTIFSASARETLGVEASHSWSSWDLLGNVIFAGDFTAAAKLLAATEADGFWGPAFFDRARRQLPRLVAEGFALATFEGEPNQSGAYPVTSLAQPGSSRAHTALTVREALDTASATEIELENNLVARVGSGIRHGLFRRKEVDAEGGGKRIVLDRITSWIAWRPQSVEHLAIDPAGHAYEAEPASYSCQVVDAAGRRMTRDGFSAADAVNPTAVLNRIDLGAVLPEDLAGRRRVEAMLRSLGRHDAMDTVREYHALGWMLDEGLRRHVFLAPAGSVSATGPTEGFQIGSPPKSAEGALTAAAQGIGYPEIPERPEAIRAAAQTVPEFLKIVPHQLDLGAAVLGLLFASPLALTQRTTVNLIGDPDSGKTFLSRAAQSFLSICRAASFTGGPIAEDSAVSAAIKCGWLRHSVAVYDDYAMGDDQQKNAAIKKTASSIIKLAYGMDGQSGGNREGGLRAVRSAQTSALITGEGVPTGAGVVSRMVKAPVHKGDVGLTPKGGAPYDNFMAEWAPIAAGLFGAYLQWLAGRIDDAGLPGFTAANDKAKREWTTDAGRGAETVSTLAVGWLRFRQFAKATGFADLLPAETTVKAALEKLITVNTEAIRESNPALLIIEQARNTVGSKMAYIDTSDGRRPTNAVARALGWTSRTVYIDSMPEVVWEPGNRMRAGVLSKDRESVVILGDALRVFKRDASLAGVPKDQLERGAKPHVVPGTSPGDKAPLAQFPNRQRGWVIPLSMLDIDLVEQPPSDDPDNADLSATSTEAPPTPPTEDDKELLLA